MANKATTKAVAYLRTSSKANVGADKDSDKRQREAVASYARHVGYEIVDEFYDVAVSGVDPIETRRGFSELLDKIEGNGVHVVLVEDASRFARDLVTQELGILALIGRGVRVLTAGGDDLTSTDDPFKVAMRQIAGAFVQLEKARLVAKLRAARERKKAETGKCGGRMSVVEYSPETVALAKKLARYPVNRRKRSLREIAAVLMKAGHVTRNGTAYTATAVAKMIA